MQELSPWGEPRASEGKPFLRTTKPSRRRGASNHWWFTQCKIYGESIPQVIETIHPLPYYTERLRQGIMDKLPATYTQDNEHNRAANISQIARDGIKAFDRAMTSDDVMAAVEVAGYIDSLRNAIEPHMPDLMKLCDSPLGFRTDRSPAILESNQKKGRGATAPYSQAEVKECAIEALLRGVKLIGDQFNIISGRCYIPLNGYKFLLNCTGASGLKYSIVKVSISESEHIAKGRAAWELDGKPYEMSKEFFCKAHGNYTTWEQTEGKATRKLLKSVYERITSRAFHDEDEGIQEGAIEVESKEVAGQLKEPEPSPEEPKKETEETAAKILALMGESEVHPQAYLKYLFDEGTIKKPVGSVFDLVVLDPDLAGILVRTWPKRVERFHEKNKVEVSA